MRKYSISCNRKGFIDTIYIYSDRINRKKYKGFEPIPADKSGVTNWMYLKYD